MRVGFKYMGSIRPTLIIFGVNPCKSYLFSQKNIRFLMYL
ncbi:unnamed protein product [Brassica rapa subsp. narinosa]